MADPATQATPTANPDLDEAVRALDAGDFGRGRRLANAALASATDDVSRTAARAVADRMRSDWLVGALYLSALAILVIAIVTTVHR
jgi:hypothetical protein